MRDTTFSIVKALAILLVVVAHAAPPLYLARFAYLINVPVFFLLAGYFFRPAYAERKTDFVVRRFKRLYFPFVKWSIFFLLIHNLLFPLGLLSEQYGNTAGGVTHPYTWHVAAQNLWDIVFHMSGYDPFLGGAFWFFRAMLLASLAFFALFLLTERITRLRASWLRAACIALVALSLATWSALDNLHISGIGQGGYREIMGVFFIAVGFMLREAERNPDARAFFHPIIGWVGGATALVLLTLWQPVAMNPKATNVGQVYALALAGTAGFFFLRSTSLLLDRMNNTVRRGLIFLGDNTLYVFAFHLLAFKVVSALKVGVYGLPWAMVGGHPVVTEHRDDFFWMLYAIAGVALPLLWVQGWRNLCERHHLKTETPRDWLHLTCRLSLLSYHLMLNGLRGVWRALCAIYRWLLQSVRDIIEASNPQDED